jgi:uncharacterized protein
MLTSNLTLAFVTGLISSFGHCLGMCGGIVAIYSARQPVLRAAPGTRPSLLARLGALAPVHAGRLITYMALGALIGLAGSLLDQLSGAMGWQGFFSVVVGLAMVVIALSLMEVLPPLEVVLARVRGGATPMQRMRSLFANQSLLAKVGLGILWGFLPCGLVFAMLVVAARAQSPVGGALTMLAFGLGTVPTLLGFGLATNLISPQLRGRLQTLAAVLILVFALQTILRGLAAANVIPPMMVGPVMLW